MEYPLNTLGLAHKFMAEHISPGDFCIDATAGKGRDTAFLCSLVGPHGRVLAMDIQPQAVSSTKQLIDSLGFSDIVRVVLDSHENMENYADENSADGIMFNLGWLPGGDHNIFSKPDTTIKAINSALRILKPGGVMTICIYFGRECGYDERDRLLEFFPTIDQKKYTVIVSQFVNRRGDVPIPVFILKN